ncbi:MAG: 3-hydroxybutyrate dehydrogenase [Rickettsiaceae bacterium]|jgi:3-hydroxybutyrate dehydrogenase|nr:3-hydroxybutyrate dehydrogenase [Rickettsiaceae bacterium]
MFKHSKTALITGSTSGIGLGIATVLAKSGYNIVLNGFADKKDIEALQRRLAKNKVKVAYSAADMTNPEEIEEMITQTAKTFGSIDVLVNNAGIQHVDYIENFPPEKWDAIIAINLSSAFHTIHNAMPYMKKQKSGRIINIASAHGLVASPKKTAYVAAKHGIIGLTKAVALEVAEKNITCNAICPGWVLTPLVQKQIDAIAKTEKISPKQAELKLLSEKQPAKEFVQVEQIGELVLHLAGESARLINGSAISIDGGWTAQ